MTDRRGTLYPFAVEAAAQATTGVARAALVPSQNTRVLALELTPDAPPAAAENVRQLLSWAELDDIVPVKKIPVDRRHNAKVDYIALRQLLRR